MNEYNYYGLFLTDESGDKLKKEIKNDIILGRAVKFGNGLILDHCTLLHHKDDNPGLRKRLDRLISIPGGNNLVVKMAVTGIGASDFAMAFRIGGIDRICNNKIPHVTICTFDDGRPVDSNYIESWTGYKKVDIEGILKKIV